jgi:tetratricopeptide (TPR) repeat protein
MAISNPSLQALHELRNSLSKLKLSELQVGEDGRNRCLLSILKSTTGRNQPSTSKYIFGPAVWLRGLIKPKPGHAVAYIDWSQQEFGIAAALSKDPDNTYLLNNYAYYLSERNENMSRAKELGDKLIKKEPDNANFLDTYGWILFRMREYDNAKVYLEKASEKGSSGVVAEHLGDVLFKLGEKDKALEKWKKAKELGGDVSPKLEKKIATKTLVNE